MELVSLDLFFLPQKGFVDGPPITKGVRCVVNNQSLLDTTHIILIIDRVMANTHPKSPSKKRSVVGLSGKKWLVRRGKNTWQEEVEGFARWH